MMTVDALARTSMTNVSSVKIHSGHTFCFFCDSHAAQRPTHAMMKMPTPPPIMQPA